jgi:hypothetical protein
MVPLKRSGDFWCTEAQFGVCIGRSENVNVNMELDLATFVFFFRHAHCSIHFYSKTNQMHNISDFFYFGTALYMFWTVSPSIIRCLRLYIQHHTIQVLWLLATKQPQNLCDIYLMLCVQS